MFPKAETMRADAKHSPSENLCVSRQSDNVCGDKYPNRKAFWSKALPNSAGCWIWQGAKKHGYGRVDLKRDGSRRPSRKAHRVAWELHHGRSIPRGYVICHRRRDVPACINPDHLFLGTQTDNVRDQIAKGRLTFGKFPLPHAEQSAKCSAVSPLNQ